MRSRVFREYKELTSPIFPSVLLHLGGRPVLELYLSGPSDCKCPAEGGHLVCADGPWQTWQLIIKYFAATEPGISLAVQRHFDVSLTKLAPLVNVLTLCVFPFLPRSGWPMHFGSRKFPVVQVSDPFMETSYDLRVMERCPFTEPYYSSFLLGALDVVINTARVKRYLEKHGIREGIHWDPRGHHGSFFFSGSINSFDPGRTKASVLQLRQPLVGPACKTSSIGSKCPSLALSLRSLSLVTNRRRRRRRSDSNDESWGCREPSLVDGSRLVLIRQ